MHSDKLMSETLCSVLCALCSALCANLYTFPGTQNGMGGTWTRFNDDSCEPLAKLRLNDLDKIRGIF